MNRLIKLWLVAAVFLILGLLFIFFPITISSFRPGVTIKQSHLDSLYKLEEIAVQHGDYPIGAIILYKDSIIGTGFNDLKYLNKPTGHAEINAIKDVFQSMHYLDFRDLSRDSLVLITSFEPCMMCKGTINYYDIRKVYFYNPKKIRIRLRYLRKDVTYYLKIRRIKRPKNQ
jgi:tRNA(Arg) A34 adenosine deaminase TadA